MTKPKLPLKVIELFAGVGGFRLGLEGRPRHNKNNALYEVVWSNQWEPGAKTQHAAEVYNTKWNNSSHLSNKNIEEVIKESFDEIPDHNVLVGGFPCQDYSVARTLNQAEGIIGKKGVLWWSIYKILKKKKNKPQYLILENVDRLLKSPASKRGRDFAIMLSSLAELGYAVEWRVINAADYGFPQRRRRIFILGYHKTTDLFQQMKANFNPNWLMKKGVLAKAFPVIKQTVQVEAPLELQEDLVALTNDYDKFGLGHDPFRNAGMMLEWKIRTCKVLPRPRDKGKTLKDILERKVSDEYYIDTDSLPQWRYLKGAKNAERVSKSGHKYAYSEGPIPFPDPIDRPARTIVTGEGGSTPSRFKHVVSDPYKNNKLRRLTPVELEKLNGFPKNHTKLNGLTDARRAFFMGNALVVGVVRKIGKQLIKAING
jgi:DNA (cytosine-5)-methyltransferase 1